MMDTIILVVLILAWAHLSDNQEKITRNQREIMDEIKKLKSK